MIRFKLLLSTFLILLTLNSYSQTSKDSTICINQHQVKVINLAFNELDKMIKLDSVSREQLGTKDLKIKQLQAINNMRSNQLIDANIENTQLRKELRQKSIKIVVYQVALLASLVGLVIAL
jgi:hypothetical protein